MLPATPFVVPTSVPHGRTARRVEWPHLPPPVRREVEQRIGAPVVEAVSRTTGFTPGFASVLADADGGRHFVKAASDKAQRLFAAAYREEARKLAALPADVPAPRLLWTAEVSDWFVLSTEYVEGRHPARPWRAAELDTALDLLETVADRLTPPPAGLELATFVADYAELPGLWRHVAATRPDLPHLDEAAALAARLDELAGGATVVHTDVRDDNLLLGSDGRVVLCDWNFPCVGAAWLDTVMLMVGPRGDGLDVDAVLAARALTRNVPADDVDCVIALLVGYFWRSADQPVPSTSPYIRDFQRWQGDVCWAWLSERRGWSRGR